MEEQEELKTHVPDGDYAALPCGDCDRQTRHQVLAETRARWSDPQDLVDVWKQYQIVQCQGCLTISFCEASQCSEDVDYDMNTGESHLNTTRKFFPSRI